MIYINNYNNLRYLLWTDEHNLVLEVDGKKTEKLKQNQGYQIKEIPTIIRKITFEKVHIGYLRKNEDGETMEVIDLATYENKINALRKVVATFDGVDEVKYLEAQIPLTIYQKGFVSEYEDVEKIIDVEFKVLDYSDDKVNDFVFSLRYLGQLPSDENKLYTYQPDKEKMFKEIALKYGFVELPKANSYEDTKGLLFSLDQGLRFAKIAGSYMKESVREYRTNPLTAGTKKECLLSYQKDYDFFENYVAEIKGVAIKGQLPVNIAQTMKHYDSILDKLRDVQVKNKASIEAKNILYKWIQQFKEELIK